MAQQTVQNNAELSTRIRQRRLELGLTVEEAALKAGVGTKTWSRYETGGAIRRDKSKGICKALNWHTLSDQEDSLTHFSLEKYRRDDSYSQFLEKRLSPLAAVSFVIGSEILLDDLAEDIDSLSSMPKGSHIGELDMSFMADDLPVQFLMNYDYEFLLLLRSRVTHFRNVAHRGDGLVAHSVIDELTLYLIMRKAIPLMEIMDYRNTEFQEDHGIWEKWVYEIFEDDNVLILFSNAYLPSSHAYHFSHWLEKQFWADQCD